MIRLSAPHWQVRLVTVIHPTGPAALDGRSDDVLSLAFSALSLFPWSFSIARTRRFSPVRTPFDHFQEDILARIELTLPTFPDWLTADL